jgi:hypothetical protein
MNGIQDIRKSCRPKRILPPTPEIQLGIDGTLATYEAKAIVKFDESLNPDSEVEEHCFALNS